MRLSVVVKNVDNLTLDVVSVPIAKLLLTRSSTGSPDSTLYVLALAPVSSSRILEICVFPLSSINF